MPALHAMGINYSCEQSPLPDKLNHSVFDSEEGPVVLSKSLENQDPNISLTKVVLKDSVGGEIPSC